jgi:hypothetical protein
LFRHPAQALLKIQVHNFLFAIAGRCTGRAAWSDDVGRTPPPRPQSVLAMTFSLFDDFRSRVGARVTFASRVAKFVDQYPTNLSRALQKNY